MKRHLTTALAIAICTVTAFLSVPATASPGDPDAPTAPNDLPTTASAVKGSTLSPRLQRIAADQNYMSKDPETQADIADTEPSGPGSVVARTPDTIAVTATYDPTIIDPTTLSNISTVGDIDPAGPVASLDISPTNLAVLAATPGIIYVDEVVQTSSNAACPTGATVSEGAARMRADIARSTYGTNGAGVTIGIISDSYNAQGGEATGVASGELPGTGNPCGYGTPVTQVGGVTTATGDEGRAMAEIIHDIAPGAKIIFAPAKSSLSTMANSIRALAAAGATIIVDDITFYNEPMYQSGLVENAITDVTDKGVLYFSSAGNFNYNLGTSNLGGYSTPNFRAGTCPPAITAAYDGARIACHDFDPGGNDERFWSVNYGGSLSLAMGWNEPSYGVHTDLDICLLNAATNAVMSCGWNDNKMSKQASEWVTTTTAKGSVRIVVVRASGNGYPAFRIVPVRGAITGSSITLNRGKDTITSSAFGHNVGNSTISVAAQPYHTATMLEPFSSAGPAAYCWRPVNGTTASAQTNCTTSTVDITGIDGGANSFFGSYVNGTYRFFGTSASAPHVAGVAALVKQAAPCASAATLKQLIISSGKPVSGVSSDRQGSGVLDAALAVQRAKAACSASSASSGSNPQGAIAAKASSSGMITVDAWAFDADAMSSATTVMVTVNGSVKIVGTASGPSPELYAYGVPGNHGFDVTVQGPSSGTSTVCLFVLNIGGGTDTTVGCTQVTVPSGAPYDPQSSVITSAYSGTVTVKGWSFDQSDFAAPVTIMVTYNGEPEVFTSANLASPELYPYGVPGSHGMFVQFPKRAGAASICVFAFNVGAGNDVLANCTNV